jgi:hypothetical protein
MGLTLIGYETVARIHSVQLCPMLSYSEHSNEPSDSTEIEGILDQPGDHFFDVLITFPFLHFYNT